MAVANLALLLQEEMIVAINNESSANFFIFIRLVGGGKGIFVKTLVCQVIVIPAFIKSFSFES